MENLKIKYYYSDGKNWIERVFTISEIENGEPFEVLSDQPLLKGYSFKHRCVFTGLLDKNGKEIYEGDILYMNTKNSQSDMEVCFENGMFVGKGPFNTHPLINYYSSYDFIDIEIIGHIYTNS